MLKWSFGQGDKIVLVIDSIIGVSIFSCFPYYLIEGLHAKGYFLS